MVSRAPRKFSRMLRVNELVRDVLGDELERLADPRLELVTVMSVDVSPDLRNATVYYGALGRDDPSIAVALKSATPRLRKAISREARLKYLPDLKFKEDPSLETGQRVEEILRKIRESEQ